MERASRRRRTVGACITALLSKRWERGQLRGAEMNNRARSLSVCLLAIATAFATVMHGQTAGVAPAPGAAQGGGAASGQPPAQLTYDFNDHEGWKQVFDGRTLNGWDGSKNAWRVEDGAIVGESTVEHPTIWNVNGANTGTAWLILNGKLKNFEFKTEVKLEGKGTNSGIFFRATRLGAIPDEWLSGMRGRDVVEPILGKLLALAGSPETH